jgi:hypothetical protein
MNSYVLLISSLKVSNLTGVRAVVDKTIEINPEIINPIKILRNLIIRR